MKKDCDYTKRQLRKYLHGHLFKFEQARIARHLNSCPLCRSEFQALRKVADTKQLLKDITPPESLGGRVRQGVSGLARLKVLIYRPLWLVIIVGIGVLLYINFIAATRRDVEIENIEKSLPTAEALVSDTTPTPVAAPAGVLPSGPDRSSVQTAAADAAPLRADPLVISIIPDNEDEAIDAINKAVQSNMQLRYEQFSNTIREINGKLTTSELLALFNGIKQSGKVRYSRKRFDSFPAAEIIPFVLKLKQAPKAGELSSPSVPAAPVSAPTQSVP